MRFMMMMIPKVYQGANSSNAGRGLHPERGGGQQDDAVQ